MQFSVYWAQTSSRARTPFRRVHDIVYSPSLQAQKRIQYRWFLDIHQVEVSLVDGIEVEYQERIA